MFAIESGLMVFGLGEVEDFKHKCRLELQIFK
jgi:hypothetical protein